MTNTTEQERSVIIAAAKKSGATAFWGGSEKLIEESGVTFHSINELTKFAQLIRERLAGEHGEAVRPDFFRLANGSDYWYECPDDAGIIGDLIDAEVGTEYQVHASHTYRQTYIITKVPDDVSDDTEVELIRAERKYFTKPPQPQSVKAALEKAAKLLDEVGCKLQQNVDSLEFIQGVGSMVSDGETAIHALITDTQEKG